MAKSRETFSKKEKEKKKLKKKQDKQEKKEARKASSSKGDSLEDMLAYVDENGNLTSSPPDPTKRKKTDASSIEIGVPRQEDIEPADLIRKGTIQFFNESKGYGFIKDHDSQDSVFVHVKELIDPVKEGDKVNFEVERTPKGLSATNVKLLS